jgi:hypothetical protein
VILSQSIRALLAGSALVLSACFDFDAPIDREPQVPVDSRLMGTWRCLPSEPKPDAKAANFVVSPVSDRVYSISFVEEGEDPDRYEAYGSSVKGRSLLNVRDLAPRSPAKPWSFARYAFLRPDVLQVQLVNDELLKGTEHSPASLRAALERLDSNPGLYVEYCVCLRATVESKEAAP